MIVTTDYDDKHVLFRKRFNHMEGTPLRCNHLLMVYVTEGEINLEINYTVYNIKKNSLINLFPFDIVTRKGGSNDYDAEILAVPISLFSNSGNFFNLDIDFYERLKWNPVITFSGEELMIVNKLFDTLDSIYKNFEYQEFEDSALAFVQVIFQLYRNHMKKHTGYSGSAKSYESRKKTLFRKFIKEIIASHSKSREVLYYANELGVSSGYLNEICNEVSNSSAKDIIDSAVSSRLKYELSYTDKSIQEIADEYNFPSQSYFSRYYKRMTGVSPTEFRKNRQKG